MAANNWAQVIRTGERLHTVSPSGLAIRATTSADDGVLAEFYRDYDVAFVLANEKENYDGFAECLALNGGADYAELSMKFGPFREFVLVAYEGEGGARIGGANFIAFPIGLRQTEPVLSINLNYIFINQPFRRRGLFKRLVRDMPEIAFRLLSTTNAEDMPNAWRKDRPQIVTFIEQNDP